MRKSQKILTNLSKRYRVPERESGPLASLRSLGKRRYRDVDAVLDVSFTIEEGEMVGLLGPNGAGKTTMLKMMAGLLQPTSGVVTVAGYSPAERDSDYLRRISMVQGNRITGGWSIYVKEGRLKYCYHFVVLNHTIVEGEMVIPTDTDLVRMEFAYDGGGLGKGGTVTLYIDGDKVGQGRVEEIEPFVFSVDETFDIGIDDASVVSSDCPPKTNRFNGEVNWVEIDIDEAAEDSDHLVTAEERFRVAMGRQ